MPLVTASLGGPGPALSLLVATARCLLCRLEWLLGGVWMCCDLLPGVPGCGRCAACDRSWCLDAAVREGGVVGGRELWVAALLCWPVCGN